MLVSGGKHYGHLEIELSPLPTGAGADADAGTDGTAGAWRARLSPVYLLPELSQDARLLGFARRVYDDIVTLVGAPAR